MTTNNTDDPIIEVQGLWKRYGLPPFLPWRKGPQDDSAFALRDISFSVPHGGALAILGRNGAGKSTLLKLLAGVTPPDRGSIKVRGSIFPMIELTAGMSMELSGRENAKILGTIMGKLGEEYQEIVPKVLEFSELGDWFERPIWQYSSGMLARLAFSIAINVDADILIVDEVLGVGDIQFQKKCERALLRILANGVTLILVTHSTYQATRLCGAGMVLQWGKQTFLGETIRACAAYIEGGFEAATSSEMFYGEQTIPLLYPRDGSGQLRITKVCIEDEGGNIVNTLRPWESYTVKMHYTAFEDLHDVNVSLRVIDSENKVALSLATTNAPVGSLSAGSGIFKCTIPHLPILTDFASLQIKVSAGLLAEMLNDVLRLKICMTDAQLRETAKLAYAYTPSFWELLPAETI